ncbi:hypothetical protein QI633_08230 [Nocardioides sp. QY071]|uniref:hypothetical protein n=1 Tax=Nocardioides sp. QY071 TaxID=3044187 RepID=UPI00249C4F82|nr:hypothetical protein [Nocardioides sp. QY071]WGY03740.1 hypothetical protein QI633_08230 [Nocardioides sp. QY071]
MCDVVSAALRSGVSRRSALTAALGGAAVVAAPGRAQAAPRGGSRTKGADARTRLVLLGTAGGPPWYDGSSRAGIASALVVGDRYYLVDAGHGVGPQIQAAGTAGLFRRCSARRRCRR